MAAILRQQFVVDPRVQGTITLYSERAAAAARGLPQLPRGAARPRLHGRRGRRPATRSCPKPTPSCRPAPSRSATSARRGDQIMTQIFRLNYENANNLVPVLRPLISPNNTINANPGNNSLVITDYADNLQRHRQDHRGAGHAGARRRRGDPAAATRSPPTSRRWCSAWPTARRRRACPARRRRRRRGGAPSIAGRPRSNSLIVRAAEPGAHGERARADRQARPARRKARRAAATSRSST